MNPLSTNSDETNSNTRIASRREQQRIPEKLGFRKEGKQKKKKAKSSNPRATQQWAGNRLTAMCDVLVHGPVRKWRAVGGSITTEPWVCSDGIVSSHVNPQEARRGRVEEEPLNGELKREAKNKTIRGEATESGELVCC